MSLHLDERPDGAFAFYIDGDLQFDSTDERLYHEGLALPALCLAPASARGLRVLICGGGDGLALRECLRFPGVTQVDLVDYDPEVVALGLERFADLNVHAFDDARVRVTIADAWEFLEQTEPYDVILCDFTVPRRPEETRCFTLEWYERVLRALAPDGVAAFNAVSPQKAPEAFWCLRRTVRAAGFSVLPYRVCIPSFRAYGYGAWGFLLASRRPLRQTLWRNLRCPVTTQQTDIARLWRGAHFRRSERRVERRVPVHTLANPCLLRLLFNPGALDSVLRGTPFGAEPYGLDRLMDAIPIAHPYHTRLMIETLAEQVVGTIRSLDIPRLVDALLRRASRLPGALIQELRRLQDFLRQRKPAFETFVRWSARLFAILVILITLANAIAPDNAFAKGSAGLGHAGISRGYASEYATRSGSFSGQRSFGGSFGSATGARSGSFGAAPARISSSGFRGSYGRGESVDIYGNSYGSREFVYCGSGYSHIHTYFVGNGAPLPNALPPERQKALFVAEDDMMVMQNSDVVITLSDSAFLLVTNGTVALFSSQSPNPLFALYPDPNLFHNIRSELEIQQKAARQEIGYREDWLSWVGWTSGLFPAVAGDRAEAQNLRDLVKRIETAQQRIGEPPRTALPATLPPNAVELFVDSFLLPDRRIALRRPDGYWEYTDFKNLWSDKPGEAPRACPPLLASALRGILTKLHKEFVADIRSDENDLQQLASDLSSLLSDLSQYQALANKYGYSYQVDYGTEEISASDALDRTNNDLASNRSETQRTKAEIRKLLSGVQTMESMGL